MAFRILLVDDDPVFCALASATLKPHGSCVVESHDGAEAMMELERGDYDIAIIDLSMPKIDGFRLIAHIRHTPRIRNIPIVVVTTRTDETAWEDAHRLGIEMYLTKPIDWLLFPRKVLEAAGRH